MECINPIKCKKCGRLGYKINTYTIWLREQGYFNFPNEREDQMMAKRGRGQYMIDVGSLADLMVEIL